MPLPTSATPERPYYNTDNNHQPLPHWKQPDRFDKNHSHLSELPPLELLGQVAASLLTSTEPVPTPATQTSTSSPTLQTISVSLEEDPIIKSSRVVNLSKNVKSTTTQKPVEFANVSPTTKKVIEEIVVDEMPAKTDETSIFEQTPKAEDEESTTPSSSFNLINSSNSTDELDNFESETQKTPTGSDAFVDNKIEIRASKEGNQIRLDWDQPGNGDFVFWA